MSRPRATRPRRYGVVVPAKPVARAKSRLAPMGEDVRRELAGAMLLDTVLAADASPLVARVLVVTDDLLLVRMLADLGVGAIPDGRPGLLNETLALGAAEVLRRTPGMGVAALCGDLPALRPEALGAALDDAPVDRAAFVADAGGSGTTLYAAPDLELFAPRFGPGSRAEHLAGGAVELSAGPSLRRDVDTPDDLDEARRLGVGPRTSHVLTRSTAPGSRPAGPTPS